MSLGFFLLIGWVVALNREVNHLESVVVSLSGETSLNALSCADAQLRILAPTTQSQLTAGQDVAIFGTTVQPDAARYQIEYRPAGGELWELVGVQRRQTDLGLLTTWDTSQLPVGAYDLRLTAVDRQNIPLPGMADCQIAVALTP